MPKSPGPAAYAAIEANSQTKVAQAFRFANRFRVTCNGRFGACADAEAKASVAG
jgi:hypothetical protein